MYRFAERAFAAAAMLLVTACFGGADDALITFSTNGAEPDRYADGQVVLDGECYALVWSKDGAFDGINADGTLVDSEDKLLLVAAVASEGHCPEVVFQLSAKRAAALANGKYGVVLLDTRINKDGKVIPRGTVGGRLSMVNGFGVVTEQMKVAASSKTTIDELLRPEGLVADRNASAVANVAQPRIKHIWIEGNNVFLRVENLGGFMRVQGGGTPNAVMTMGAATQSEAGTGDVILVAPQVGTSGVYKVQRN